MLEGLRRVRGRVGVEDEREVAAGVGVPVAVVHGVAGYYADLRGVRGRRRVRVCAGTACFVAGGGRQVAEVEEALGVRAGECSADGEVSVQAVHCLGFCYGGPAALDGETVRAGPGLGELLVKGNKAEAPEIPVRAAVARPVLLGSLPDWSVWPGIREEGGAGRVREEVARSGLRGRGGAGFPIGVKWETVAAQATEPKYVVANGDEGDPGSFSDRLLMERYPAKVLEGLTLAGLACGARQGFVYVRSEYPAAFRSMTEAVARARAEGHLRPELFDVEVVRGAGSYLAGEETSLLRSLEGLRATARARPPYPVTSGYLGAPTAVNNVETLATVPAIVATGGAAYARLGRAPETGTVLVCLNERFTRPGVYEVELGTPIRRIVEELGGGLREGRALRALQIGGPLGGFLAPDQLDLPLLESALKEAGAALGHGGIVAVDDRIRPDDLLRHLWDFAATESCGACTPCREGTFLGASDPAAAEPYLDTMEQASLCAFGRGVPRAIRSLRRVLKGETGP